jgi:hypothetical protein
VNRRTMLATLPLLAFPAFPDVSAQRHPDAAEITYGPAMAICPEGKHYWLIATSAGAFPIPDYDVIEQLPPEQFVAVILACGEWTLQHGHPHRWSHELERWEMGML